MIPNLSALRIEDGTSDVGKTGDGILNGQTDLVDAILNKVKDSRATPMRLELAYTQAHDLALKLYAYTRKKSHGRLLNPGWHPGEKQDSTDHEREN